MKIHSNYQNQPNRYNNYCNFTSSMRVTRANGNVTNRNWTTFFREDLDWNRFADNLIDRFRADKKVNIYCLACSDGSEPYTLAMLLISKLGKKNAEKFFPIIASDKDKIILKKPIQGKLNVSEQDLLMINGFTRSHYSQFITKTGQKRLCQNIMTYPAKINNILKDSVVFKNIDANEALNEINKNENNVIFARNFLQYLSPQNEQQNFVKLLTNKLKNKSLFAGGDSDYDILRSFDMFKSKIKQTVIENCYEKNNR